MLGRFVSSISASLGSFDTTWAPQGFGDIFEDIHTNMLCRISFLLVIYRPLTTVVYIYQSNIICAIAWGGRFSYWIKNIWNASFGTLLPSLNVSFSIDKLATRKKLIYLRKAQRLVYSAQEKLLAWLDILPNSLIHKFILG